MNVRITKYIAVFAAVMLLLLLSKSFLCAAPALPPPPKMRPYSGIGIIMLAPVPAAKDDMADPLLLYEEPAIHRIGALDASRIPKHDWIFGSETDALPLVVVARKGNWLRVVYDEAGREAWLIPREKSNLEKWDIFLKGRSVRLLNGLQKRYYRLFQQPGRLPGVYITSRQGMKVVRIDGDWAMVISDQNSLSWLRWRDEDGRLLVGLHITE